MRIEETGPVQWRDVQMFLPVSDGHGALDASYLVIHETAEPGATAADHIHHWTFNDSSYAVHYVADWSDIAYHAVKDDRLCWHVGGGNAYTVGIELCHATNQSDFERVWETGVQFAAYYLDSRGWGIDRLLSHNDCTNRWGGSDHTDPLDYFESFGRSWEQFKAEVEAAMSGQPIIKRKRKKMECLIRPNGENYMVYFDGVKAHPLHHPDEMKAIQMCYRQCTGEDIPCFEMGTHEAPWFTRLEQGAGR